MRYHRLIIGLMITRLVLAGPIAFAETDAVSLTIHISGAKPKVGQALCALFSSPETYLKQPLATLAKSIDDAGEVVCQFSSLKTGTYAASVIYDEDLNGELNTGLFGIPTEFVGMSNNAKGLFGPPSFEQTSFSLSTSTSISIVLGNAKE